MRGNLMSKRIQSAFGAVKEEVAARGGLMGTTEHSVRAFKHILGKNPEAVLWGVYSGFGLFAAVAPVAGVIPGLVAGATLGCLTKGIMDMSRRMRRAPQLGAT